AYFLRPKHLGGRGWKTGGYHRIVELDGSIKKMYDFETITNGVGGFNTQCLHISYVGGVQRNNVNKPLDSRTPDQRKAIIKCIVEAINWLKANGKDITKD